MNIALFADVHGRILLCFKLCARWQQETGQQIDIILQAGDLGVFPGMSSLDKATKRHAVDDPTELGFMQDFAIYREEVANQLQQTHCPLIFVRGNHEDQHYLDEKEQASSSPLFSVDAYQRIWCLRSGVPYTFSVREESVTILGIGRIGAPQGEKDEQQSKYIQAYERRRLAQLSLAPSTLDIVLSHDAPRGYIFPDAGIAEIGPVLERAQPHYHFFGHYDHLRLFKSHPNQVTTICKLADLCWDRAAGNGLVPGSFAILSWHSPLDHSLEIISAPWLHEYRSSTWKWL
ncbi:MAG TPA: metallophosphoesterase [Ktedonobacteraceae bacterium]|jgi:Icc-related predicted phosphoesterase|nr:metallophosphoesterase [Ktedonobacteraceae bacterium]